MESTKEEKELLLKGLHLQWSIGNETVSKYRDKIDANPNGTNTVHISNFTASRQNGKRRLMMLISKGRLHEACTDTRTATHGNRDDT